MKNVSKAILACLVLFATFMTSCDKEITTSPVTLDNSQKATIKGYVYANTDLTKLGYETAPAGTKVIITMAYNQITGISSTAGSLNDTVQLAADGSFEYKVPADADGVDVDVAIKFVFNQIQPLGSQNATRIKTFTGSTTYSVKANETQDQKITLDEDQTLDEVYDWVTISGVIYCNYDLSVAGNEKLPANTQIIFRTNWFDQDGWSKTVTVGTDGKYSVSVPSGYAIYMQYNFTLSGKYNDGTAVTYRFENASQSIGSYTINTKNVDENIVAGVAE